MKRIINVMLVLMVLSLSVISCTNTGDKTGDNLPDTSGDAMEETENAVAEDITGSIAEADTLDEELAVDEVDSDLNDLEQDLSNW